MAASEPIHFLWQGKPFCKPEERSPQTNSHLCNVTCGMCLAEVHSRMLWLESEKRRLRAITQQPIEEAVAEEREACAKIVLEHFALVEEFDPYTGEDVANKIRARGNS